MSREKYGILPYETRPRQWSANGFYIFAPPLMPITELYFSEKIFPCDTVPLNSVAKWQMKMKTFLVNPVFYPEEKDIVKIG